MKKFLILLLPVLVGALGVGLLQSPGSPKEKPAPAAAMAEAPKNLATATFAGGCFWCVEADLEKVPGVVEVISGYTGGRKEKPTYEQVSAGGTGHLGAVA